MNNIATLQQKRVQDIPGEVRRMIHMALSHDNIFESVMDQMTLHYGNLPTKTRGNVFEVLCLEYLRASGKFRHVWLFNDVPPAMRASLGLGTKDMGIDLVCERFSFPNEDDEKDKADKIQCGMSPNSLYCAVQAKYRKRSAHGLRTVSVPVKGHLSSGSTHSLGPSKSITIRPNVLRWGGDLATFYALCARTGPWHTLIVMTTCDSISWQGKKVASDKTYAYKTWCNIDRTTWLRMAGSAGNVLEAAEEKKLTHEEVCARRWALYGHAAPNTPARNS